MKVLFASLWFIKDAILQSLYKAAPLSIKLVARTGKAAARLTESILGAKNKLSEIPDDINSLIPQSAQTIHRLLGVKPFTNKFRHDKSNPLHVDVLIIDFNNVRFLDTDDFVVLACLIESYYINNCEIRFEGGTDSFNSHLFNIRFKEYWKSGFDRGTFTLSKNKTTLCLWKISKDMIYSYSMYAREYFERFAKNKDLIPLASNMDEVFNNVIKGLALSFILDLAHAGSFSSR